MFFLCVCDCRRLCARVVIIVLVQRVVVSFQYDGLVIVGIYLCFGDLNQQSIYNQR